MCNRRSYGTDKAFKAAGMTEKITTDEGGVRYKNVIDLSSDDELSKRVGDLHGSSKYKVIQQ